RTLPRGRQRQPEQEVRNGDAGRVAGLWILRHGAGEAERAAGVDFAAVVVIRLPAFAAELDGVRPANQSGLADQRVKIEELSVGLGAVADAAEAGNAEARDAERFGVAEQVLQTQGFGEILPERTSLQEEVIRMAVSDAQLRYRVRIEGVRNAQRDVL